MKKDVLKSLIIGIVITLAIALYSPIIAQAEYTSFINDIRVKLDGEYVNVNPAPFILDGHMLVSARAISEILGATVVWDGARQVFIELNDTNIILTIDSNIAVVNGQEVELDVPAHIVDGSTIIPLCFIVENLGFDVDFYDTTYALSAIKAVLQGQTEFFDASGINLYINQLTKSFTSDRSLVETVIITVSRFAVVDLDNDGTPEVVLWLQHNGNDYFGSKVLRYHKGVVYGYTLWYRGFSNLKADGTFSFSSSSADGGFGTLRFIDGGYSFNEITYSESDYSSGDSIRNILYFVNQKQVTRDVFELAYDEQREKEDVTWYDFTNDNIDIKLDEVQAKTYTYIDIKLTEAQVETKDDVASVIKPVLQSQVDASTDGYIKLENGILVDKQIFEDFGEIDSELIIELISRHFKAINTGDKHLLISTLGAQDGSDFNLFHPAIINMIERWENNKLSIIKLERPTPNLGSLKILLTDMYGIEVHIWVELLWDWYSDSDSGNWSINRYLNHHSKGWWMNNRADLWEYVEPFHPPLKSKFDI